MEWDAVGAIAESLGAIGVIATLIYLTSQIRQNTKALYRTEMNTALSQWSSVRALMLSDPSYAAIMNRGRHDLDHLSPEESIIFDTLMNETFHVFRHTFYRSKEGIVSFEEWEHSSKPHARSMLSMAGINQWWQNNSPFFPDDFVAELGGA